MTNHTGELYDIPNAQPDDDGIIELALIPTETTIVYPHIVRSMAITTQHEQQAIHAAIADNKTALLFPTIGTLDVNNPEGVLFRSGIEVAVRTLPQLDDEEGVIVQGRRRMRFISITQTTPYIRARAQLVTENDQITPRVQAFMRSALTLFRRVVQLNPEIPPEVLGYAQDIQNAGELADLIASTLTLDIDERRQVLDRVNHADRIRYVISLLGKELTILEIEEEIDQEIEQEMQREQREAYLREQMRIIQSQLGEADIFQQELDELRERVEQAKLTPEAYKRAMKEISRLAILPPMAPEIGLIHNYIDWLVSMPWQKTSIDNLDLHHAQRVLDEDHYGLPRVKDRVLEHIAVRKLAAENMQTPILCFLGPPGTGKTSLGKSIARALGREFARMSLGGVRDEAEIRGHRRTYVGAMPGRIIQTIREAGTLNPVVMLDEIDKLGADFHGDPAAALLEVLDPEQNNEFVDHYLDVSYDLSQVMFITTANDLYPLPPALEDRLEVIEFPGYIEEEKLAIAQQFLIPKQLKAHGIAQQNVRFETAALQTIIREYTYEAGVRNMNRRIAEVLRKVARQTAEGKRHPKRITPQHLNKTLGPPDYTAMRANDENAVGVVTGLAWTSGGGDVMTIEVVLLPGKGTLTLTGQLGDVMQESAQTAMSYMRSLADELGVSHDDFDNYDLHIHLPEGSVPKDGPSAGITLAIAIISAFTERPIRCDIAMTGEITLRGKVLPVGGIREKVMAARRARIPNLIIPELNKRDLVEVPRQALKDLNILLANDMRQIIDEVLLDPPDNEAPPESHDD